MKVPVHVIHGEAKGGEKTCLEVVFHTFFVVFDSKDLFDRQLAGKWEF